MAGSIRVTAAGILGVSGKSLRIYGFTTRSGVGGPGTVTIYDGTTVSGTEKYRFNGNTDASADKVFSQPGKFFPNGCYVDVDQDVIYVDFDYLQEQTS